MADLIDRQAAIDALFELYEYQRDIDPTEAADLVRQGVYLAEKKIEQLPSAQPEIIRCRECKFYTEIRPDLNMGICDLACRHLDGDGFYSEAERKTDE